MTPTFTPHRARRLLRGAVAGIVGLGLALAPAGAAQAKPKAPKTPKACKAGAIKTTGPEGDRRVYVCNTAGKWIEVVYVVVPDAGSQPTGATQSASDAAKRKGGTAPKGCVVEGNIVAQVGEEMVITEYVKNAAGATVAITHTTLRCGSDGRWTEARTVSAGPEAANESVQTGPTVIAHGVVR